MHKGLSMKTKRKLQIAVDVLMTAILLLQMSYSLAGELLHEITGICFFALLIIHHVLSFGNTKALFRGRRTPDKIMKAAVDILLTAAVVCILLSAIPISQYVFTFLGISALSSLGRTAHMLGAYWGFALKNSHNGFHLDIMLSKPMKDKKKKPFVITALALVFTAGLVLFIKEGVYQYMLLINRFVFFDTDGGLPLFLAKYILIGGMFAALGFSVISIFKARIRNKAK